MELVPASSWYKSLKDLISIKDWNRIRNEAIRSAENKCEICYAKGRIECHEIWSYDEENHFQYLDGLIALCKNCHLIKHWGYASSLFVNDETLRTKLIKHFLIVNGVDNDVFESHKNEVTIQWRERSNYTWEIDYGKWSQFLKVHPNQKNLTDWENPSNEEK